MRKILNSSQLSEQISLEEINRRPINLVPILLAHQLVLLPLYFFLPLWIVVFNSIILFIVYFSKITNKFNVKRSFKIIITFAAVAGVLFSFHRLAGRDAGVSLIAIMYGLKIIEIESKRDVYILMLLGFFLMLATFLFSRSPYVVIYQFIPVLAILYALQSIHSIQSFYRTKTNGIRNHKQLFREVYFNTSSKYLFQQLIKYLVLALPIMILLFLFFPRLSGPIWKMPGHTNATSGISETMTPGAISSLHLSDEVAFRAKFYGEEPSGNDFYWRTLVLDTFDGLTWSHTNVLRSKGWVKEDKKPFQKISSFDSAVSKTRDESHFRYEIALEATQQRWLAFLDKPSRVISIANVLNDFSIASKRKIKTRIKYRAESQTDLILSRRLTEESRRLNTLLPKGYNPRSIGWAKSERKKVKTDELYIQTILKSINDNEYFYTLSPPVMDENTVDSFWLDEQKGFCEHYAGALVFMARAVNIPARVVIGYQGAEKNILSDYWIIRHSNAHAWTEIWFSGKGWVRIDPTAAIAKHRIEDILLTSYTQRNSLFESFNFDQIEIDQIGFSKQLGFWLDQINSGWDDWFLEYNQNLQRKLMMSLGLDKMSREQIALLSLLFITGFMLLINVNWKTKVEKSSILFHAINLLSKKLVIFGIVIPPNRGFEQLLRQLKSGDLNLYSSIEYQLTSKSLQRLESLLHNYQLLRYAQNNCSEDQQKAFYKCVKKLKLTRLNG